MTCYIIKKKYRKLILTQRFRFLEANIPGINVYSLHPGVIPTEISRYSSGTIFPGANFCFGFYAKLFCKNVVQGAQTTIYCSVDEKTANDTGLYYS